MKLRATNPHEDCIKVIESTKDQIKPSSRVLSVKGTRQLSEKFYGSDKTVEEVGTTQDLLIPGPDGDDLPIRVYVPDGNGTFPVLLWAHGGGFILGNLRSHDPTCRILTNETKHVVVSVDYRLAPENPFPHPLRDFYQAIEWVVDNAEMIRADPGRVSIGGQSAGGNLTAAAALMAQNRDRIEDINHQVLIYPVTDFINEYDSMSENSEGYYLSTANSKWYKEQYIKHKLDAHHPYVSMMLAPDLSDLPSATVVTAGFDPLRDEGIAYAERLEAEGIAVHHEHYPDMIHGFFAMHSDPAVSQGRESIITVADHLNKEID